MRAETHEILDAIGEINQALSDQLGPDNTLYLEYNDVTWSQAITFMNQVLWCSEDDEREWIESNTKIKNGIASTVEAHYEDMEQFLRKKIKQVIAEVKKIKL